MSKPSKIYTQLGKRISQLRLDRQLSQETLAFKAKLSRTYVGAIERGDKRPSVATLDKLAKALEITLSELFDF